MDIIPYALAFGLLAYYYTHRDQIHEKFWRWITKKSPYFLVATKVSLTHKGAQKYLNKALVRKVLDLEAKLAQTEERLHKYEEAIRAFQDMDKKKQEWEDSKIDEILSKDIILKPKGKVKVFNADYKFVGYLEYVAGSIDEAYAIVRSEDNTRKIFGPAPLNELFINSRSLGEQLKSGMIILAYDSQGNRITPSYVRVEA